MSATRGPSEERLGALRAELQQRQASEESLEAANVGLREQVGSLEEQVASLRAEGGTRAREAEELRVQVGQLK